MNRTDIYEKGKITKSSSGDIATNIYFDAFKIEKVRFQNMDYPNKSSIDCYVSFEDLALLATDVISGSLFEDLKAGPKTLSMGGTKSSKKYGGAPESRVMSIDMEENEVFLTMSSGKGNLTDTGLIIPESTVDKKITVTMHVNKFRSMIIYTYDCVRSYLTTMVSSIVDELENDRKKYLESNTTNTTEVSN